MDRTQAERLIAAQAKPLFGFALRRCATIQDAEDVAQEIALRAYQALLSRDDVTDPLRYLWTVAHNVLANHYRDRTRVRVGIADFTASITDFESVLIHEEAAARLRKEIAHLSRQQREIVVAHYFHGQKQADIAVQLGIPLGTVKWHLSEAKKELKNSMERNRPISHLQFDPIRFSSFGTEGSFGDEGSPWRIFRQTLHQNIVYAVWRESRTVPEIAEAMGVSPVYIEDAVEYLTEQGYLTEQSGRYRCSILLTEHTNELTALSDRMYREAAALIAPALYAALTETDLLQDETLYPGANPTSSRFAACRTDRYFALWALIPWCIANSQPEKAIPFSAVASLRPDGGRNIVYAGVTAPGASRPALYAQMDGGFSGPCWNETDGITLWQLDTCWSDKRIGEAYHHEAIATLGTLRRFFNSESLAKEEYASLAQKGLLRISGNPDAEFTASLLPVWLRGKPIREKLLAAANAVYTRHAKALAALHQPYADMLLADTPVPLRKLRQYMLQNLFQSDWFIMHCLHHLAETGRLIPPDKADRPTLHTIILTV